MGHSATVWDQRMDFELTKDWNGVDQVVLRVPRGASARVRFPTLLLRLKPPLYCAKAYRFRYVYIYGLFLLFVIISCWQFRLACSGARLFRGGMRGVKNFCLPAARYSYQNFCGFLTVPRKLFFCNFCSFVKFL